MKDHIPVPVKEAREVAEKYDKGIVIIITFDIETYMFHTTTFGKSEQEKHWAAIGGEKAVAALGGDLGQSRAYEDFRKEVGKCGDANPKGNVLITYKGSCGKDVLIEDAYRCTGCDGWFHKDCIISHFELEKDHDWGRKAERKLVCDKIAEYMQNDGTIHLSPADLADIYRWEFVKK